MRRMGFASIDGSARNRLAPAMMVLSAIVLWAGCLKPAAESTFKCKDRAIHVNREKARGVEEETIVVCAKHKVKWAARHEEKWSVHFEVSPFKSGAKDVKPGEDPGAVVEVEQDTAFKYSITVDDRTYDPQIIIMGGH